MRSNLLFPFTSLLLQIMTNIIRAASLEGNVLGSRELDRMLVRARGPAALANAARPMGYTTGAAVCSVLSLNEASGAIEGASFSLMGEEGVQVADITVPGKKIWPSADRTLEIRLKISLNTLKFSGEHSDKVGFRCCSAFVDLHESDDATAFLGNEMVDKEHWGDKEGLKSGACFRVFLEPESATQTKFKVVCAPISLEKMLGECGTANLDPDDPAIPVISLARNLKLRLYPAEPEPSTSGMGILPFLFVNSVEGPSEMPSTSAIKAAHFKLMRDVVRPLVCTSADWEKLWNATDWEELSLPPLLWPQPPAGGDAAEGE